MTLVRGLLPAVTLALLAACGGEPASLHPDPPPAARTPTATATPSAEPTPTPSRFNTVPTPRAVLPTRRGVTPGSTRYAFPIEGCRPSYGRAHHDYPATDIFTRRGCAFVSPVAGRVDEVALSNRWQAGTNRGADRGGLFVSIVGDDGVRYYGSHLESVAAGIRPGVRVRPGTPLGRIGTTGSARGTSPHLHFGISWPTRPDVWWVRRGTVEPWPFLDSWRVGGNRSPIAAVRAARDEAGTDEPPCRKLC